MGRDCSSTSGVTAGRQLVTPGDANLAALSLRRLIDAKWFTYAAPVLNSGCQLAFKEAGMRLLQSLISSSAFKSMGGVFDFNRVAVPQAVRHSVPARTVWNQTD
jgi:hypothetical protein